MKSLTVAIFFWLTVIFVVTAYDTFSCPDGWDLRNLNCYKYFDIKHSWEKSVELCRSYGAKLVEINSFIENDNALSIARCYDPDTKPLEKYWIGLAALDDLRQNTLTTGSGTPISKYSGFWSLNQPDPLSGECVASTYSSKLQSWSLGTCDNLLPFICHMEACPNKSFHCGNGLCINQAFKCDDSDDCGDGSDELDCPTQCHYFMQSGNDVIESPNYPQKYNALSKCKWTLESPLGSNIILQFQDFETEKVFDTVQILVGGRTEDKSVSLASLSGKMDLTLQPFVSASNFMIIKFTTDGSIEHKGFKATWKTEAKNCGGTFNATSQRQILTSPNYPKKYPGGLECLYIIKAAAGIIITIEVVDLDIAEGHDFLLVRDGDSPISRPIAHLSGTTENNKKVLISSNNALSLYFKSSLGYSGKGFRLQYIQGCNAIIIARNGTVTSPAFNIEDYPKNQECSFTIRNNDGLPVSLKFDKFNVHESDYVQVYDGSSKSALPLHSGAGFTGTSPPNLTLTALSGEILVKFNSDALHSAAGWSATFSTDCPQLKLGMGALASSRDTAFGTVVSFTCPIGQEFATGKNKIVTECLKAGHWNVSYIPKCQEVYCGPVPQIDNGFSIGSSNVTYRGIAMYKCYAGFTFPSGAPIEKISCLVDARWEQKPTCTTLKCAPLPEIPHANVTLLNGDGLSYGTIVQFECELGYERNGYPVLICMSNGTWSGEVPRCTRKRCYDYPEIENGFVVDAAPAYYYGDDARIQCFKGYKLIGSNIIRCNSDQIFDNPPECKDINECTTTPCDLATTECINTNGSFHCNCRSGFTATTECRSVADLGLSNGDIPDESITTSASEKGYVKTMLGLNSVGWCGASAKPGHNWILIDLKAPTVLQAFRMMSVERIDGNIAYASAVRLQYANELTDVFKDYDHLNGTAVEFRILKSKLSTLNLPLPIEARYIRFRIQEYVGAPCLRMEVMGCKRFDCVDINECSKNNGGCKQMCINSPGGYSCACKTGYQLYNKNGTAGFDIELSETGERDGDTYQINKTCVPVLCPALTPPENGKLLSSKKNHHFGDVVRFYCNFSYIMAGSSAALCQSNGQWNATVPECHDAKCVSLSDDELEGVSVLRPDPESVLVPFLKNVTINCKAPGHRLKGFAYRQCVYDPKPGLPDYWLSGSQPSCQRLDCYSPMPTPGAKYGQFVDTRYQSSFFFNCQNPFKVAGQTSQHDNVVRCQADGVWDFGDLRCDVSVCEDPGRPSDGRQMNGNYEQGSKVYFGCNRPGYILINPRPITCIRNPECKVIKPLGITSGKITDFAITATSEQLNYEAKNIRLNSATGWCGESQAYTNVSVDLGQIYRIKTILVKGVVTNDIVGRPTEIRFFYKKAENENYAVHFPNFNLTMRDPGNYAELVMITLPKYVLARFVILGIVSHMGNACLKFELMGCEEPKTEPLLGYDYGYSPCIDNEPPIFQNCPQQPIIVKRDENGGVLPVNFIEPTAVDNSGSIARLEVKPQNFKIPFYIFNDTVIKYKAFDYSGNVAVCEINISVPDITPPSLQCPESYVIELVAHQYSYNVNFNDTRKYIRASDDSGEVRISFVPESAIIVISEFQNVTVIASDKFNNTAYCHFQVAVQASPCVEWELEAPANGYIDCLPRHNGMQCIATCKPGYRFVDGEPTKIFSCETSKLWKPTSIVPDCVSVNAQLTDYQVTATVSYRANGIVAQSCLSQYQDYLSQHYFVLNQILSHRCSTVNVNMKVTFVKSIPTLLEGNLVKIDFILSIISAIRQPQLYELCGSTLNLIFDLTVPNASAVIKSLLSIYNIGYQCPSLRAFKSNISRGFSCSAGEFLSKDTSDVSRCLHCPAGTYVSAGQSFCTHCPRGYYQNLDRQDTCLRCPAGTYTKEEGSKSLTNCIPVCGYGTYSPTGLVPCSECPRNSYTAEPPISGFKVCQACPQNMFTFQPAASSKDLCRQKCVPGFYSSTGLAPCSPCPINYYQTAVGSQTCNECPTNMRTNVAGTKFRDDCKPVVCGEGDCQNGGLCVPMDHNIQCFCSAGFSGKRCENDIDECASQPCYNGGSCTDLPRGYRCECPAGYSGINCQEDDCINNTCSQSAMYQKGTSFQNVKVFNLKNDYTGTDFNVTIAPYTTNGNPCSNGASYLALQQGRYKCDCLPGWEGIHCELNIDDCSENPCLLGGNCTDLVNDFQCACPPGFTGKRCEEKINLCLSEPCKQGTCVDRLFDHECVCHPGWTGSACDINFDDCANHPCANNGTCVDLINGYSCTCKGGYTGKNCQHSIDECESNPCQNGATCIDQLDGFICKCRPGYVGLSCVDEINECLSNPCNPVGTKRCLDLVNAYECECHDGFTGELCETDIDDCAMSPCLNGAVCHNHVDGFECICENGWSGMRCEQQISTCNLQAPCQNNASCIDLFQNYYCVCPSGTDGKNCETAPDRCIDSPCMHGGKCQVYGSGLNCTCPKDFIGIGCQYELDACEANLCQNGATCINNGLGYSCLCPKGYTGKNCEEDIIDCTEKSCPPGAPCIDLTNEFYCQCAINMTGDDCKKPIQVNYDLLFSNASRSTAAQVVPFYTGKSKSLTIAMWVQFAQKNDSGIFFSLFSVESNNNANKRRMILQANSSGVEVSIFNELKDVFLSFGENTTVNDGQWHHIAIVWDGSTGQLQLITDGLITSKLEYAVNQSLPLSAWTVLGHPQVQNQNSKNTVAYAESGFQGTITKAQVWGRALDITNEIQKQARGCHSEAVIYNGLILNWSGYEVTSGGVERYEPSLCGQRKCPSGYAGANCQELQVDKQPPIVEYCPGDLRFIAKNGSAVVSWDKPHFSDNVGVTKIIEKNGYHSGITLLLGSYDITYIASDAAGNTATCSFKVSLLSEFCPHLADPVGGTQECKDWGADRQFKVCKIACNAGLRFSEEIPEFYTCGAEGFWRPMLDVAKPQYPSCSSSKLAQRIFHIKMLFQSSELCNKSGKEVLRRKVISSVNSLNRDWNFCLNSIERSRECKEIQIDVKCDHYRGIQNKHVQRQLNNQMPTEVLKEIQMVTPNRQGYQQTNDSTYMLEVSFPAVNDPVTHASTGERSTIKSLLEKIILKNSQFTVQDILPNIVPDPATLELSSEYVCPVGEVVMIFECVPCAIGTYYSTMNKTCAPCDRGTYQSEVGQLNCTKCPVIAGRQGITAGLGAHSAADCKERCPVGKYFDLDTGLCKPCGYGFYQPNEGSFSCELCGLGQTTHTIEATSIEECHDECSNGMQLGINGHCEPCPRGTFRSQGVQASCAACPLSHTTAKVGANSVEECNLSVCSPGTFFNKTINICVECLISFYQPESQQTSCIQCPANHSTKIPGATSISECTNPNKIHEKISVKVTTNVV